ncbi:MAG: hypothetical protein EZS28_035334 [Streblomastix strix]|uniref:Uncharacterized protein n=1 Tax=Streblomastix strix TaxID=222440 RepID=A0A5J4UEW7_9EUKA|nr:MAG: hypothetical protein EZS28_035334 [Streblomastix strix]
MQRCNEFKIAFEQACAMGLKNSLYEYQLDDLILEDEDSDEYEYNSDGDEIPNTSLISPHITRNSLKRVRRE